MTSDEFLQAKLCAFGACDKYGIDGQLGKAYNKALERFTLLDIKLENMPRALSQKHNLKCPCGSCDGYGNGTGLGQYRYDSHIEAYNLYEYPKVSEIALWAAYGIAAMFPQYGFAVSSGYRCKINNERHGRRTTNHFGKAVDIFPTQCEPFEREHVCDMVQAKLLESGNFQMGWRIKNRLSLEPRRSDKKSYYASDWIHVDCRSFDSKTLNKSME